jgi:hypothetical protein
MLQVKIGDLYGYCDKTGTILIAPRFIDAGDFAEGLAEVKVEGKWGYIDTTGAIVIPPQFAEAGSFSDGLADVTFDEAPPMGDSAFFIEGDKPESRLWGYIDKQGKVVIPPRFNFTGEFSEGLAPVGFGKKSPDLLVLKLAASGGLLIRPEEPLSILSLAMFMRSVKAWPPFELDESGATLIKAAG